MAGSSNFQQFNPTLANSETDAEYTADAARTGGFTDGLVSTKLFNKAFAQFSAMAAAIGGFIADAGGTASDTDVTALKGSLRTALTTVGEIEAIVTGTVGVGSFTSTTTATIPSCSKLLWVSINGLIKSGATRTNATTIAYNETRIAGDVVVIHYVAS
jgi:hypothetical protein